MRRTTINCIVPLFISIYVSLNHVNGSLAPSHHDWDVLIFTQHWPITVCLEWKEDDPDHTCILPHTKNIWTVHGIWPTKLGTIGPGFCNSSWHFDVNQLAPIETRLEEYWGNVHTGSRYALWEHEWVKHGTCAAVLPPLSSELLYFGQGLKWVQQYGMDVILKKAGIEPDTLGHDAGQLYNSVKNVLGKDPAIECLTDKKTGLVYLFEIRICFDKSLQLTDCDGIKRLENGVRVITNCPAGKDIIYPLNVPTMNDYAGDESVKTGPCWAPPPKALKMHWLIDVLFTIQWIQWFTF